ncbi:MAG TPA: hypothetical protein PK971_17330, partial [Saprospiraceae bacterium]|nr:hypothetical protein [Saprospiraceae bacterium]
VWHDEEPFSVFNKKVPRFMSEYGFQSFPDWRTIQAFTLPEDRQLESKVMLLHQKHPRGNALIAEYMKRDYRMPEKFEDFVYVSQLLQAEGMRTGIEAHRRHKPYCMGSLYWQLNDVWPVASWSSIDCFGRWKALHYYVREAFSACAALPYVEGDSLSLYGVCDFVQPTSLRLRVRAIGFEGKNGGDFDLPSLTLRPDSAQVVWKNSVKNLLSGLKPDRSVVEITLTDLAGITLYRRLLYLEPPRKLDLPKAAVALSAMPAEGGYLLTLRSPVLAKNVHISTDADGSFADNYFDLLPGETRQIMFKTEKKWDDPAAAFRVRSLADVGD